MKFLKSVVFSFLFGLSLLLFTGSVSAATPSSYARQTAQPRVWFDPKPTVFDVGGLPTPPSSTANDVVKTPGTTRSCEVRIKNIKTRSGNLVNVADSAMTKFNSVLTSVDSYYAGTVVASGYTVANYKTLRSDVSKKQADVDSALSALKADAVALSCTNLKASVEDFNKDARSLRKALEAYRSSLHKLINAVHGFKTVGGTPHPTCVPRPACLDNGTFCVQKLNANASYCPKPTDIPVPTCVPLPSCTGIGCLAKLDPRINWCKSSPAPTCVPLPSCYATGCLFKLDPNTNWCKPTPTCVPRPACLDQNPPCKIVQRENWCMSPVPVAY